MPVLARTFARLEELHVGFDATLRRIHLVMDEMLDEAVGGMLERHRLRWDDVCPRLIFLAKGDRGCNVVGPESAVAGAHMREIALVESFCHGVVPYRSVGGRKFSLPLAGTVGG